MHLSSGFLLVETVPGREGHVLELLSRFPGVTHRSLLFPAAIAVKVETSHEGLDPLAKDLRALEGVLGTRLYRARNA
jgi:hypothetical protein